VAPAGSYVLDAEVSDKAFGKSWPRRYDRAVLKKPVFFRTLECFEGVSRFFRLKDDLYMADRKTLMRNVDPVINNYRKSTSCLTIS